MHLAKLQPKHTACNLLPLISATTKWSQMAPDDIAQLATRAHAVPGAIECIGNKSVKDLVKEFAHVMDAFNKKEILAIRFWQEACKIRVGLVLSCIADSDRTYEDATMDFTGCNAISEIALKVYLPKIEKPGVK